MEDLRIVRGNDFILEVPVRNIVFIRNEETGEIIKASYPVNLDGCEILKVHIVNDGEWKKPVPFTVNGGDLKIKVDGCIECGWYGIEVFYKLSGYKYRSYERKVFKIVENNGKSYVNGEQYEGEHSYQVDIMWTYGVLVEADLIAIIRNAVPYEPGEGENSAQLKGGNSIASGALSHAEGIGSIASGNASHAEGYNTTASGSVAHAEGLLSTASGNSSHAEGVLSAASGLGSHAGGHISGAHGIDSFSHGNSVVSNNVCEVAFGRFNASHTGETQEETTAFSVGIGSDASNRKNGFELMQDGSIYIWLGSERKKLQDILATLIRDVSEITEGTASGSGDALPWTGEPIDIDPYGYPYEPVGSWDDTDNNVNP